MTDDIRELIATTRKLIDQEVAQATIDDPMQWHVRRAYLDGLAARVDEPQVMRNVFVSYSKRATHVFSEVKVNLDRSGLTVHTGFDRNPDAITVLDTVIGWMNACTIYVGILTPDIRIASPRSRAVSAPAVWTIEEKGMALALGKPYVLMIHKRVHHDFWRKTAAMHQHHFFDRNNYREVAKDVCASVVALRHLLTP